jgi:hypothetical protein
MPFIAFSELILCFWRFCFKFVFLKLKFYIMIAVVEKNQVIDKQMLKDAFLELMLEDKAFFQEISQIVLKENNTISTEEARKAARRERLDKTIDKHFDQYDAVFKALA